MWKIFFLFFLVHNICGNSPEKPLAIIIPSYNNALWVKQNLESIFKQDYSNYRIIYIDDCSTDTTVEIVESYMKQPLYRDKITLIKNVKRSYAMANRYNAIHQCKAEEIVLNVDGDDWLYDSPYVFSYLNEIYQNPEVWMTYGRHLIFPNNTLSFHKQIPEEIVVANAFRKYKKIPSHLYSFYAEIFHTIKLGDLLYEGEFLQMAHSAYMYPIIEMAGRHSFFIEKPLYIYNLANSINDHKVDKELQLKLSLYIHEKEPYKPLAQLSCMSSTKKIVSTLQALESLIIFDQEDGRSVEDENMVFGAYL